MLTPELRKRLYFAMARIRSVEERIAAAYGEQEMRCPVHLSIGQEAVAVGVCAALERSDYVLSTHRAHAHYLAKGGDLRALVAEIYGKVTGCSSGKGGSMHLADLSVGMLGSTPIVGSSLPVAVGTAFGSWMQGLPHVTTVFFGEGATEEGVFMECLNFAALKRLPILFVCENNLYSVYSPLAVRQSSQRDRVALALAHDVAGARSEGNDVEAVFSLATDGVARARRGEGPTYLEFATYRWREHCGPNYDNDLGYRTNEEFLSWRRRCPVDRYQRQLQSEGLLTNGAMDQMWTEIREEIDMAMADAKRAPFPDPAKMLANVFAEGAPN